MKRFILAALTLVAALTASADDIKLFVVADNAPEKSYPVAQLQKITFADGKVCILSKDGTEAQVAIANVKDIYFDTQSTPVEQLNADSEKPALTLATDAKVAIHTVDGYELFSQELPAGTTVPLRQFPRGVYIVTINGQNFKVAN